MNRQGKEVVVETVKRDLERSAGVLFLDYTGLTVEEANGLRGQLRDAGMGYAAVKNTLLKKAMSDTSYDDAHSYVSGSPTGVVFGFDDAVASARLIFQALEECRHLRVKGGILEQQSISPEEAKALSEMSSKSEVQAGIVSLALSPGANLAGQLKNSGERIQGAIKSLIERLEEQEA
jgi:large subunit ribosomal protein L10